MPELVGSGALSGMALNQSRSGGARGAGGNGERESPMPGNRPPRSQHGRRRALGRGVYALAACAVVAMTGLAAGTAAARGTSGAALGSAATQVTLTSVGTDGAAATSQNARAAISANGRYVAFQSQAVLNASGSVIPPPPPPTLPPPTTTPPPTPPPTLPQPTPTFTIEARGPQAPAALQPGNFRVYVRDQVGHKTSLLSNPNDGAATAPSISGTGKLVSYLRAGDLENNIVVVNRQATGAGDFDTSANLAVKTVTGTPNDTRFERIPGCPTGIGDGGAVRTTPCGPKLSADGSTLAYPAQLSPVSPALVPTAFGDPIAGNLVDFGETSSFFESDEAQVDYTVQGTKPVTLTGFTVSDPSFSVSQGDTSCVGTLQPGVPCTIFVNFNTSACPDSTPNETKEITATLQTDSLVPDGQSSLTLVVFCNEAITGDARVRPASPPATLLAAAACPAPPKGLPVVQAPPAELDNTENSLVDFGQRVAGQPFAAIVKFTGTPFSSTAQFSSPDCGLQLISPAAIGQPPGPPVSCTPVAESDSEACTAYVLVRPGGVGTDVASFIGTSSLEGGQTQIAAYVSVTSLRDVVIARHDTTGAGNFAASPSTVVSVDGTGTEIPDASEPSVSATGRYVAFTASGPAGATADSTAVWRHDTDAAGNRTFHSGATIMVSCLPTAAIGPCDAAQDADSPSMSGDGSQVAFATIAAHDQVYVRNVTAGTTALASAPATGTAGSTADGDSYAPAMSQDASTVAYISTATDLAARATPGGAANLYVRTMTPNAPLVSELATPSGASLPARDDIALPDIDARGGLVTFQTSQQLLPTAPRGVTSVYTFEREPVLAFQPAPVSFGSLPSGNKPANLTVTVTDIGPGAGTVTTAGTSAPFGTTIGACAGAVLHDGDSCLLTVSLIPQQGGNDNGTLTATATDDLGSPVIFSVPVTAIVVVNIPPPSQETPRIAVNPSVAPEGQVTDVKGGGFLAGQHVTLSWDHGLGQVQVVATGTGGVTAVMVIFPDDYTGPRVLQARDLTGKVLATANFLVQQDTIWPPIGAPGSAGPTG